MSWWTIKNIVWLRIPLFQSSQKMNIKDYRISWYQQRLQLFDVMIVTDALSGEAMDWSKGKRMGTNLWDVKKR